MQGRQLQGLSRRHGRLFQAEGKFFLIFRADDFLKGRYFSDTVLFQNGPDHVVDRTDRGVEVSVVIFHSGGLSGLYVASQLQPAARPRIGAEELEAGAVFGLFPLDAEALSPGHQIGNVKGSRHVLVHQGLIHGLADGLAPLGTQCLSFPDDPGPDPESIFLSVLQTLGQKVAVLSVLQRDDLGLPEGPVLSCLDLIGIRVSHRGPVKIHSSSGIDAGPCQDRGRERGICDQFDLFLQGLLCFGHVSCPAAAGQHKHAPEKQQ